METHKKKTKNYINSKLTEVLRWFFNIVNSSDFNDEDIKNPVFKITVATPYLINDITDFMSLTGMKLKETEALLKQFSKHGISNIKDVNTLVKMGYFRIG